MNDDKLIEAVAKYPAIKKWVEDLRQREELLYQQNTVLKDCLDSKWRGIDSAPKDGKSILLFERGCIGIGAWRACEYDDELKEETAWEWQWDGEGFSANPTHWMPLPQPPQEGK
jgi:hypothetical protein